MKIDLYTKIVLSLIAAALITLCVRSLQEPAQVLAQQSPTRVVIAGIENQSQQLQRGLPVYLYASNPQQPVSVNLSQLAGGQLQSVPVTVVGAGSNGKSPIPVNVVQVAGKTVEDSGIPVVNQK